MLSRITLVATGLGFLVGLGSGYFWGQQSGHTSPPSAAPAVATPPGALFEGIAPIPAQGTPNTFAAEHAVTQNPKDFRAWVILGNTYFDSHQHQKAVDAYAKALALDPKHPDVWTDQGVMYRELGAFDKAVANFEKAQKLDPAHVQSLFNLGVVYANDLKAPTKAEKAWKQLIAMAPTSPQAAQAQKALEHLKGHPQ